MPCLCETAVYSPRLNCFLICLIVAFLDAFSWVQLEQIMLKFPQPGIILLEIAVVVMKRTTPATSSGTRAVNQASLLCQTPVWTSTTRWWRRKEEE